MSSLVPQIVERVLDWSRENGRDTLPWRRAGITPYEVWVSEIMLQQTQVSRVIPYFERFLQRFPTVESLADASWEAFLPYYAGLGYYARGRNMLTTAQLVVEQFDGKFPKDEASLRSLPGIGPYTAKAILSFGYGQPHLAFDTNQQRVFGRVVSGNRRVPLDVGRIESEVPSGIDFRVFNGALMDFANAVCTKTPRCDVCPLRNACRYVSTKGELEETTMRKKVRLPLERTSVILILHRNHREYYSASLDSGDSNPYEPFRLPASLVSRAQIKEYFLRKYGLELSVRPPHLQGYLDEQPVFLVNAQILLGESHFRVVSKEEARPVLTQLEENLVQESRE